MSCYFAASFKGSLIISVTIYSIFLINAIDFNFSINMHIASIHIVFQSIFLYQKMII